MSEEYYDVETDRVIHPGEGEVVQNGNPNAAMLMKLMQNPGQLSGLFSLNEQQAVNVKGGIAALGTFLGTKYASKHVGDELAAGIGAVLGAIVAKKLFGPSR